MITTIDGLAYSVLTKAIAEESRHVIAESFADEPTSVHLVQNRKERLVEWMTYTSLSVTEVLWMISFQIVSNADSAAQMVCQSVVWIQRRIHSQAFYGLGISKHH